MLHTPIKIQYGTDALHFGELSLPQSSGPHPVVILIHGGFWRTRYDLSLMSALAENLAQQGIAAWNIEYRRVGDTGGGWPNTLIDVALACDFLKTLAIEHHLDLQHVVPVGHSAGGHLAFWLAARPRLPQNSPLSYTTSPLPLTGTVSLAGVVDLKHAWQLALGNGATAELLAGSPELLADRYTLASPYELLPLHVPQVLIHGDRDDRVPIEISRRYAEKAQALGDTVTFIPLAGADHFVLIDPSSKAWQTTIEEIQRMFHDTYHTL